MAPQEPLARIAFGSCSHSDEPQPLWNPIVALDPQLWIWLGDNIYADTEDMEVMEAKYEAQRQREDYRRLMAEAEIIGTWDDHDYGANNAGKEYPMKSESQELLLDFLGVPEDSPRRDREGVYSAHTFGPEGQQVKILLLDTRYHRDAPGPEGDILGEEQRAWLEEELRQSQAQIHIIGSSIQVVPEDHRFEKWANFPEARQRLFDLIAETGAPGVFFISGDRHIAEISRLDDAGPYSLYDLTSSGLTHAWEDIGQEKNRHRVGKLYSEKNFGFIEIDWSKSPVEVHLQVRGEDGEVRRAQRLSLAQLQPGA